MNFFQRQQDVRRSSRRLVVLFVVAVVVLVVVVDLIAFLLLGLSEQDATSILNILIGLSLFMIVAIGLTSLFRMLALRNGGGGKVARSLGGMPVPEDTTDPRLRRLRNVVEEMAIASGTPVPEVYVLPNENGINAFAAGFTPADAAVAVTHGALERLNRDELQGVIAHEFSHVVNGDMRLNIRLMGVLFGILGLAVIGRIMLSIRGERNPLPLIGLVLMIVGYLGVFFGRLIKAAVSRQREYLADAAAVQYTRRTEGLVGALKKIGGIEEGSKLRDKRSEDVSHMLFGEGFASWFATHPPLARRIRTLDPTFDPAQLAQLTARWRALPPNGMHEDEVLGLAPPGERPLPPPNAPMPVRAGDVVASIGTAAVPRSATHQWAGSILAAIPAPFLDRARHPDAVLPLVFGLLMTGNARAAQQAIVASRFGPAVANAAGQARRRWRLCIRCCGCRSPSWRSPCCGGDHARSRTRSSRASTRSHRPTGWWTCTSTACPGCCTASCTSRCTGTRRGPGAARRGTRSTRPRRHCSRCSPRRAGRVRPRAPTSPGWRGSCRGNRCRSRPCRPRRWRACGRRSTV